MNFRRLFYALMAISVVFAGCKEKEDLGSPRMEVSPAELTFTQGDGTQTVDLLSTRDWKVKSAPDWAALSVQEGKASTKPLNITVTVLANSGYNRSGSIVFTCGLAKCALAVKQDGAKGELKKGSGTKADPYSVWGVDEYLNNLGAGVVSPQAVFVKGIISKLASNDGEFSADFGNATFFISDDGVFYGTDEKNIDQDRDFYAYRVKFLGNRKWTSKDTQIKVGDEVVLYGKVVLYKGNTPETDFQSGPFLYSLNGKDEGGTPVQTESGTVTEMIAVSDGSSVVINDALVVAKSTIGMVVTDGSSNAYLYFGDAAPANVNIGDKVKVEATKATYGGVPEFTSPKLTVISSGNAVNYPDAKDITASAASYAPTVTEYVKLSGKLSISGKYYNVVIAGTDARQGSISSPLESLGVANYDGQEITVTGYCNGVSSGKYINIIAVEVAPANPDAKRCTVSPDKLNVAADATSATLTITANAAWTVSCDNADITVSPASGDSNATVTLSFPANTGDAPRTASIRVVCAEANVDVTVPFTQAKPASGNVSELVFQFEDVSGLTGWPTKADEAKTSSTQVYNLDGVDYTFSLSANIYTSTYNGNSYLMLASKTNNGPVYLGLPVIAGKTLVSVEVTTSSGASASATGQVTSDIAGTVVSGGEKQKLPDKSTEYSWSLSGTAADTQYYYCSPESKYNSQIIKLVLGYE